MSLRQGVITCQGPAGNQEGRRREGNDTRAYSDEQIATSLLRLRRSARAVYRRRRLRGLLLRAGDDVRDPLLHVLQQRRHALAHLLADLPRLLLQRHVLRRDRLAKLSGRRGQVRGQIRVRLTEVRLYLRGRVVEGGGEGGGGLLQLLQLLRERVGESVNASLDGSDGGRGGGGEGLGGFGGFLTAMGLAMWEERGVIGRTQGRTVPAVASTARWSRRRCDR